MSGYLIDTSIFVAKELERPLSSQVPKGKGRISVVTLTELLVGVGTATKKQLDLRERTLANAQRFIPLVFDEYVAVRLAELLSAGKAAGRRIGSMDAIIAATALVHDLVIWTQDDDFDVLAELAPELQVARA